VGNECNYHHKTDFRAFDVMVEAIDRASRGDIKTAYDTAREQSKADYMSATKRAIWAEFARMLKRQLAKY